ncbi:MAG: hypothetical protein ACYC8T_19880, partial [Myxococcaceae bacterium]
MTGAPPSKRSPLFWIALVLGGSFCVCCPIATFSMGVLDGLLGDEDNAPAQAGAAEPGGGGGEWL